MAAPNSVGAVPAEVAATTNGHAQVPDAGNVLEADPDAGGETDSAFGSSDDQSILTSLKSSMREYHTENGRTYHHYKEGQYAYPNDELEKDRLDLQHHLFKLMMDQKLHLSPIKNPQHVLDIGTGTGIWAIEFAEANPSATVIGTDLSPIQPTFIPPNISFLVDDANDDWVYNHKFDFIYARALHCAVEEKRLMKQAYDNLEPGGYFEFLEFTNPGRCDDGSNPPDNTFAKWGALGIEASKNIGMGSLDNPPKYAEWMREAGFTNVQSSIYKIPTNTWPKGKKEKTLGLWSLANTLDFLNGGCVALFTRGLGWKLEEVEVFVENVKKDVMDTSLHNYFAAYVTYGQKPMSQS